MVTPTRLCHCFAQQKVEFLASVGLVSSRIPVPVVKAVGLITNNVQLYSQLKKSSDTDLDRFTSTVLLKKGV